MEDARGTRWVAEQDVSVDMFEHLAAALRWRCGLKDGFSLFQMSIATSLCTGIMPLGVDLIIQADGHR